jgi:hypothetical protein
MMVQYINCLASCNYGHFYFMIIEKGIPKVDEFCMLMYTVPSIRKWKDQTMSEVLAYAFDIIQ